MALTKKQHEAFAMFFEEPTRSSLRELLKGNIGETDFLDFKGEWPVPAKLAKHILAMANSGGGAIVVGVTQSDDNSIEAIGIPKVEDKSDLTKKIAAYLPSTISFEILDFSYTESDYVKIKGKAFQVLLIEYDPKIIPLLAKQQSADDIRRNTVYVRRGTNTDEATHDELQELINKRLETGYSNQKSIELAKHLDQLEILDKARPKNKSSRSGLFADMVSLADMIGPQMSGDCKKYLEELYEKKKRKIERDLGL